MTHIRWLLDELPALVRDRVLSEDSAARLRAHYESRDSARPGLGVIILGVLGALLVGLGIILLIAHNWPDWSRGARTFISYAPLLTGQALVLFALLKRPGSTAWREGAGVFLMLGIGASIALVEQTYHLGTRDYAGFLLSWMLLSLPLIYLLQSSVVTVLYWVGIIGWGGEIQPVNSLWYWPLLAASLPFVWQVYRREPQSLRAAFLGWALALSFPVAMFIVVEHSLTNLWLISYSGLFAVFYLGHHAWVARLSAGELSGWKSPLRIVGAIGLAVIAQMLTWEEVWRFESGHYYWGWRDPAREGWLMLQDYALATGVTAVAAVLWLRLLHAAVPHRLLLASVPILILAGDGLIALGAERGVIALGMNLYVLALGILLLRRGIAQRDLTVMNGGLVMICALILMRFFDVDLPFHVRGLAFIAVGATFIIANWRIQRRRAA